MPQTHHPKRSRPVVAKRPLQGFSQVHPFALYWQQQPAKRKRRIVRRFRRWTRRAARRTLVDSARGLRTLALTNLASWTIRRATRRRLRAMMGCDRALNLLASNLRARVIAGRSAIKWIVAEHRSDPLRYFYHATFVDERRQTRDRETHIDLKAVGKPIRALLREYVIRDWLGVIELKPFTNWKRGVGRQIAPHTHVIFWSDTPIDVAALEEKLASSRRLVSVSGAPTVKIVQRQGVGELAHMIAYIFKSADRGGNLVEGSYRRTGKPATYDASLRPDLALRLIEILSHIRLSELMLASGDGKRLRSHIFADLDAWRGRPKASTLTPQDVPAIWASARRQAGKLSYRPVDIKR